MLLSSLIVCSWTDSTHREADSASDGLGALEESDSGLGEPDPLKVFIQVLSTFGESGNIS